MEIKLGLYETIDKHFEEWLVYDNALKLYFITSDIEIYGKEKYKMSIYRVNIVSENKLYELLKKFNTTSKADKEGLKKIYLNFIEEICKPDKRNIIVKKNDDDNLRPENYTVIDEYQAILEQEGLMEDFADSTNYVEEKSLELEIIAENAQLSDIENYALEFIRDRNQKHPLLDNFTLNGIIQIANRGAYKLYYFNRKGLQSEQ